MDREEIHVYRYVECGEGEKKIRERFKKMRNNGNDQTNFGVTRWKELLRSKKEN